MSSRDDMKRMLEQAKKSINARKANPDALAAHTNRSGGLANASSALQYTRSLQPTASSNALDPRDNKRAFLETYYPLFKKFINDRTKITLEVPDVSNYGRVMLHTLAEKCNLSHTSTGEKGNRVLQLRKDALFFQKENAVDLVDLDDILSQADKKESRYHLRRVRAVDPSQLAQGEVGSYDEDALKKLQRLQRATDEYRHATEIGYTQEELLALEGGERDNQNDGEYPTGNPQAFYSSSGSRGDGSDSVAPLPPPSPLNTYAAAREAAAAASARAGYQAASKSSVAPGAVSSKTAGVEYSERCRGCGAVASVDYAISEWSCSKYCARCTKQTIWSLEETQAPSVPSSSSTAGGVMKGLDGVGPGKRGREDNAVTDTPPEIELEDDASITADDFVDMAAMNDLSPEDVNWLRHFAAQPAPRVHERGVFCIDFKDLNDLRIFKRYETAPLQRNKPSSDNAAEGEESQQPARKKQTREDVSTAVGSSDEDNDDAAVADAFSTAPLYVVLRDDTRKNVSLASLLDEMLAKVFVSSSASSGPTVAEGNTGEAERIAKEVDATVAMQHIALAFLNVSVYGTGTTAICQLRPYVSVSTTPDLLLQRGALEEMQNKHGAAHVYVASSLDCAIACASGDSS